MTDTIAQLIVNLRKYQNAPEALRNIKTIIDDYRYALRDASIGRDHELAIAAASALECGKDIQKWLESDWPPPDAAA